MFPTKKGKETVTELLEQKALYVQCVHQLLS